MDGWLTRSVVKRIRSIRTMRGWSLGELARRANLSRSFIGKLEGHDGRGMTLSTVESLANAFEIPPWLLLVGLEEDAAGGGSGSSGVDRFAQRVRSIIDENSDVGVLAHKLCELADRLDAGVKGGDLAEGHVRLGDLVRVARGPELPPGAIGQVYHRVNDALQSNAPGFNQFALKELLQAVRTAGSEWQKLLGEHNVVLKPCYLPVQIRPFLPAEDTGSMLFLEGADKLMKVRDIFEPPLKVIVEPRVLLAMVDRARVGVPQVLYALIPPASLPADACSPLTLAYRIAAMLNTVAPSLAPGVRWFSRSYRPRVRDIADIQVAVSITGCGRRWGEVDGVTKQICQDIAKYASAEEEDDDKDAFDRCVRMREELPRKHELTEAVRFAMEA